MLLVLHLLDFDQHNHLANVEVRFHKKERIQKRVGVTSRAAARRGNALQAKHVSERLIKNLSRPYSSL